MSIKHLSINKAGCSIRCKLYYSDLGSVSEAVVCCHGFGGSKENKSAERLAQKALAKKKNVALLAFDWPCHGEDARKKLTLEDCDQYLTLAIDHAQNELGAQTLNAYATSFGGYLTLKYVSEHGNPFERIALRSTAVRMHEVFENSVLTEKDRGLLAKGKDVEAGFHRKLRIGSAFLDSLRAADITKRDYVPLSDRILMIHGTKDELVPIGPVRAFAEDNIIPFIPIENADHMFVDPEKLDEAVNEILQFFQWTH